MADTNKDKFVSRVLLIGLGVVILIILVTQYQSKNKTANTVVPANHREPFAEPDTFKFTSPLLNQKNDESIGGQAKPAPQPAPSDMLTNPDDYKAIDFTQENKVPTDCFPRDKLTAEDLLPKDAANSKWAQVNPAGQGDVKDQNFLTAGAHIGINTVGQTLRNANYQLRSEPPNPRYNIGPWSQSTIEYDQSRRHFELGEC